MNDSPRIELPVRRGTYRLGVFGSMMDPPHLGHLSVIDRVYRSCGLDRIVVVPAGLPPHRSAPSVSARARLTMAVRAFADVDHVVVSDTEVERAEHGEVGYMVDTIAEAVELPSLLGYDDLEVEATLIVGADQAVTLDRWHRFAELSQMARIVVVRRRDHVDDVLLDAALASLRTEWGVAPQLVEMPPVDISSTLVRARASAGDLAALRELVPRAIVDDVRRLYGARNAC